MMHEIESTMMGDCLAMMVSNIKMQDVLIPLSILVQVSYIKCKRKYVRP